MSTLIVGIDVSQAHNDVCAMNERGEVVERPQRFANDRSGLSELEIWLTEVLATDDYDALQIGGEATGLLWFHPVWHLQELEALGIWYPRCTYSTPMGSPTSRKP